MYVKWAKLAVSQKLTAIKSALYSIHGMIFFHTEEQLRADLEAAKALSKAGTDPQVHSVTITVHGHCWDSSAIWLA